MGTREGIVVVGGGVGAGVAAGGGTDAGAGADAGAGTSWKRTMPRIVSSICGQLEFEHPDVVNKLIDVSAIWLTGSASKVSPFVFRTLRFAA